MALFCVVTRVLTLSDSLTIAGIVASHIECCRQASRHLQYAWAVIIPEANLPFASLDMMQVMRSRIQLERYNFVLDDKSSPDGRADLPGSITTHKKKHQMVHLLKESYLKPGRLQFCKQLVVAHPEFSILQDPKAEVIEQLRGFMEKRKYKPMPDGTIWCERFYTGKEPIGHNDDFVMALLLAVYHHKRFWEDPHNERYYNGALPPRHA